MTTMRPTSDRILARVLPTPDTSTGGIILPETIQQHTPGAAVILEIGPGRLGQGHRESIHELLGIYVRTGDTVIYGDYSGVTIDLDGTDYVILAAQEILAVIPQADEQ